MIHNMWFNTTTGQKKPYYQTLHVEEWWDNGTLPIWITAQRQVGASRRGVSARGARRHGYGAPGVTQEVEKEPAVVPLCRECVNQEPLTKLAG